MNIKSYQPIEFIGLWFLEDTINDLQLILFIWICSILMNWVLTAVLHKYEKLRQAILIFIMPGVIVHELAHATMCLLLRVKIAKITLFNMYGGGSVKMINHQEKSPIVIFMIAFAPLIIGTLIAFYLLEFALNISSQTILNQILILLAIQIIFASGPSIQDIKVFFHSLTLEIKTSIRDILIMGTSIIFYSEFGRFIEGIDTQPIFFHFFMLFVIQLTIYLIFRIIKEGLSIYVSHTVQNKNYKLPNPKLQKLSSQEFSRVLLERDFVPIDDLSLKNIGSNLDLDDLIDEDL